MPELPEVECLTRAVRRTLKGGELLGADFLRKDLREPIPIDAFKAMMVGETVSDVYRRSKYLLIETSKGVGVFHLGMTGNIIQRDQATPSVPHTHAVFAFRGPTGESAFLHFVDPRRFGRITCVETGGLEAHAWFEGLGPEPLEHKDLGGHLFERSRGKSAPVKSFIMDGRVVVGVGNIYASEALFRSGISPLRKAGTVSRARFELLGEEIKATLRAAIKAGGTTFRDFKNSDGNPGYFAQSLNVYDREGEPCSKCQRAIKQVRQAGRSTFYCTFCQS